MANTALGGLRWKRGRAGGAHPPIEIKPVANNYGTAICKGDVLKLVSDGTVAVAAAGDTVLYGVADGIDQMYVAAAGGLIKGNRVAASTTFSPTTVGSINETRVRVIPFYGQVFEADCDTGVADIAAAVTLIGNNADHVATAGSSTTGRSGHVINTASGTGTGSAGFRIVGIVNYPNGGMLDNDVTLANWKVEVEVNESTDPAFTTTGV